MAHPKLELRAMAIELPTVHGHPNRLPFEGCLTLVDIASDKAPSGARGHRVLLTRAAAEAALPSLLGMAVLDRGQDPSNPTTPGTGSLSNIKNYSSAIQAAGGNVTGIVCILDEFDGYYLVIDGPC